MTKSGVLVAARAAKSADPAFWHLLDELYGMEVQTLRPAGEEELIAYLKKNGADVVVLVISPDVTDDGLCETVKAIKRITDARVIVGATLAASDDRNEANRQAKMGGCFYCLFLPDQNQQTREMVECAIKEYDRKCRLP